MNMANLLKSVPYTRAVNQNPTVFYNIKDKETLDYSIYGRESSQRKHDNTAGKHLQSTFALLMKYWTYEVL